MVFSGGMSSSTGKAVGPAPLQRKLSIRFQGILAVLGEKLFAERPMRVKNVIFPEIHRIVVFDDASRLHVGEREGLRQILEATCLYDFFFIDLAVEIHDRAVRPDGSGFDAVYVFVFLEKWNFHVRIFSPFFREYLFANIVVLMRRPAVAVVPVD